MTDAKGIWVHKIGRFMIGRVDALDDGWVGNLISWDRTGVCIAFRVRSYWLFWGTY